jgi:hypothetical protein
MKPTNIFMSWGAQLMYERPVRKLTVHELINQLDQSGKLISKSMASYPDTPANRRQLCHIIGIERWGQRRLRVALGEPLLIEEYDHYCPSSERSWEELKAEWGTTREATLALADDLTQASLPPDVKVPHNQFGPLSIKGWLRYLDVHASSTGKHIK